MLQVAWGRYVFHVVFLPFYAERPTGVSRSGRSSRWARMFATKHPWLQIARSLLLLGATLFFFGAVSYVPLAEAQAVAFIEPLLITAHRAFLPGGARRCPALAGDRGRIHRRDGGHPARLRHDALGHAAVARLGRLRLGLWHLTRIVSRNDSAGTSLAYSGMAGFIGLSLAMPFVWQPASANVWLLFLAARHLRRARPLPDDQGVRIAPGGTLAPFIYVQMLWMVIVGFIWFGDWPR